MNERIWAYLIHLGENMWSDTNQSRMGGYANWDYAPSYRDHLLCDDATWDKLVAELPKLGVNTLVVDVGDGIQFESHPELAIQGSWSKEKLEKKLSEARALGMNVVPKLNFSACHDTWLKEYSRMLSTQPYYKVVRDLITETAELFGHPSLFHLGMDEENAPLQASYEYTVVRGFGLWWHDLGVMTRACEDAGCRPWVWSDKYWSHPKEFAENMSKEVLQSNWYYGSEFGYDVGHECCRASASFKELDELGYDQVPTGSNWECHQNMELLGRFCSENIAPERLKGFMTAPWCFTIPREYYRLLDGASRLNDVRENLKQ